jgi:hypothetical protein
MPKKQIPDIQYPIGTVFYLIQETGKPDKECLVRTIAEQEFEAQFNDLSVPRERILVECTVERKKAKITHEEEEP